MPEQIKEIVPQSTFTEIDKALFTATQFETMQDCISGTGGEPIEIKSVVMKDNKVTVTLVKPTPHE